MIIKKAETEEMIAINNHLIGDHLKIREKKEVDQRAAHQILANLQS